MFSVDVFYILVVPSRGQSCYRYFSCCCFSWKSLHPWSPLEGTIPIIDFINIMFSVELIYTPKVPSRGQSCYRFFSCCFFSWKSLHPWSPLEGTIPAIDFINIMFSVDVFYTPKVPSRGQSYYKIFHTLTHWHIDSLSHSFHSFAWWVTYKVFTRKWLKKGNPF
jgi:hypothetical protein